VEQSWYLPAMKRDPRAEFESKRIPGAVFFDVRLPWEPLSEVVTLHPLPGLLQSVVALPVHRWIRPIRHRLCRTCCRRMLFSHRRSPTWASATLIMSFVSRSQATLAKLRVTLTCLTVHWRSNPVAGSDGKGIFSAGRLWWMLRAFGHDKASVLECVPRSRPLHPSSTSGPSA
jgi:hypothetical protein